MAAKGVAMKKNSQRPPRRAKKDRPSKAREAKVRPFLKSVEVRDGKAFAAIMGKYDLHGEMSVEEAFARMTPEDAATARRILARKEHDR